MSRHKTPLGWAKGLLEEGAAVVCPDNEWNAIEEALFFAKQNMEKCPLEVQWFLNRIGEAKVAQCERKSFRLWGTEER